MGIVHFRLMLSGARKNSLVSVAIEPWFLRLPPLSCVSKTRSHRAYGQTRSRLRWIVRLHEILHTLFHLWSAELLSCFVPTVRRLFAETGQRNVRRDWSHPGLGMWSV